MTFSLSQLKDHQVQILTASLHLCVLMSRRRILNVKLLWWGENEKTKCFRKKLPRRRIKLCSISWPNVNSISETVKSVLRLFPMSWQKKTGNLPGAGPTNHCGLTTDSGQDQIVPHLRRQQTGAKLDWTQAVRPQGFKQTDFNYNNHHAQKQGIFFCINRWFQ